MNDKPKMKKYFAGVRFTIEANNEEEANEIQGLVRGAVGSIVHIFDASADEPVEFDEFGHAG